MLIQRIRLDPNKALRKEGAWLIQYIGEATRVDNLEIECQVRDKDIYLDHFAGTQGVVFNSAWGSAHKTAVLNHEQLVIEDYLRTHSTGSVTTDGVTKYKMQGKWYDYRGPSQDKA